MRWINLLESSPLFFDDRIFYATNSDLLLYQRFNRGNGMADVLKNLNLSLEDLEGTSNEVLNRIVSELDSRDKRMSHTSHSSSSGSGHYSYVSGAGHKEGPGANSKDIAEK